MIRPVLCVLLFMSLIASGVANAEEINPWHLGANSEGLKTQSCANATGQDEFQTLDVSIQPVSLSDEAHPSPLNSGFHFVGGWALRSLNADFGGLSGLSIEPGGDLLLVSDTGHFVRLDRTDRQLSGTAHIAPMRFENPLIRPGKLTADAEGLAIGDDLTFVSFERDFRVLAFALEECGAEARGIEVADPPSQYGLRPIRANAGPEALWLDSEGGLHILYEQLRNDVVMTAQITEDGRGQMSPLDASIVLEDGFRPVGTDQIELAGGIIAIAFLYRAYDREQGNRVRLDLTLSDRRTPFILRLSPPLLTDNFEGVALEEMEDSLRLWIISDDNFSDRQQTLLYAFDVDLNE